MKLSDFQYTLPRNLIAKYPVRPRDASKLMVLNRKDESIQDRKFSDIIEYFNKGDVIVLNDTKVFPAKLAGRKEKTNAKIEVLLLRELNADEKIWDVIVDPARKVRIGNKVYFDNGKLMCEIVDNTTSRGRTIRFIYNGDLYKVFERIGHMPLPYYIKRDSEEADKEMYQTIYSKNVGSVAAPTAGLHFTKRLLSAIEKRGVKITNITLHIGLGTFRKVEVEDLSKHKMDSEYFEISEATTNIVNKAISNKCNIFVCGTSTARALESSVTTEGYLKPFKGWTDKFIFPSYTFKIVDRLITNFHLPESTLLMLVSAFANKDFILRAYKKAIKDNYRFYSYGDAMLII